MKNFIKHKSWGCFSGIFFIFFVFVFSSCSNLFGKTDLENSSSSENQNSSLVINLKSQSRYIAAQDYKISDITTWALAYQLDQNSETKFITWANGISSSFSSPSNSPSLSYSKENQTLTVNNFPSGTYYLIAVTGTRDSSDSNSKIELFGSASGVKISNDSSATTQIYLGLKKSAIGSGTFSLTLTDSKNQFDNYYSSLQITLRNIFDDTKYYMFDPSGATTSTLKFDKSSEQTSDTSAIYILSNAEGTTITSGFYQLIFYIDDSKRVYIPADKSIIEIADGIETLGETEIFLSRVKTYYTTNDKTALGNGLSKSSPANLSTLLNKLAETLPDEGEINICSDDVPEINIDSLEKIKYNLLGKDLKYISIYDKTQSEILLSKTSDSSDVSAIPSLMIASNGQTQTGDSSGATLLVDISHALILTAGEKTQALVNVVSVAKDSPYKITLKNGASLNVSDDVEESFVGNLQISLVQEDDFANLTDNFVSYFAKPFIEFKSSSSSSSNFELYDSKNQQVTNWNVEQKNLISTSSETSYAYYLLPQNQTQLSSAQDYPNAQIKANFSGDSQTTYSSANIIPYKSETLEFTLSFSSEDSPQISNYAWILEENLYQSSNQSDLVKLSYSLSNLKNAKTYNLSCYFVLDEKIYKSDFELKFEQIEKSAAVYLDAINYTQSDSSYYYNLKQVPDYKGSDLSSNSIEQYASTSYESATVSEPIYTFDSNFSLYVPKFNDTRVSSVDRYLMSSSDKSYTTRTEFVPSSESFNAGNSELQDIYYNNKNDYLYMLFVEYSDTDTDTDTKTPKNGILYASNGSEKLYSSSNITISSSTDSDTPGGATVNVVPMQIALNGDKLYVAGSDCNIYSTTINFTTDNISRISVGDFELLASCTDGLTGYDETLHNDGEISITDMQLGDGLGNENEKLYVLIREASEKIGAESGTFKKVGETNNYAALSRGALIEINTDTTTIKTVYGWSNSSTETKVSVYNENYNSIDGSNIIYYGPTSPSESVEFYGPTHFAAVVPKKLVILDDGVEISGKQVTNKDSFVEFDIAEKTLTRTNEKISASKPALGTEFTYETSSETN